MKKTKIFISYSSKDRKTAEKIHKHLEKEFDVWRDQTRLDTDWSREIAFALADSDALCLLWSEHSAKSKWVQHEWLTARALEKRIILCLFPNAPHLPDPINNLHGISFDSIEEGCKNLIERIKSESSLTVDYEYTILPENSYIPFRPNKHFTGRNTDLLELYLKMIGNLNKIGINQVGTVGMGGIGKTQLAVEFAFRFSYGFNAVYWIQAANDGEWLGEFVSLARDRLKLEIKDPDKPEANKQYLYALQKYFKNHTGTLVIMDNIAEPKLLNNDAYLCGLTPLSLGCDLLFTTRKHFEINGVLSQPVNVLSPDAAFELTKSYRYPETKEEEKHARSICNIVGYLPLAITLAGSYLRKYKDYFFADYREELVKKKLDIIDIGKASEEDLATRHVAAVTATLESQWEMLKDMNSRHLFKLSGQFPEAAIIPKARLHLLSGIKKGESKLDRPFIKAYNYLQEICLVEQLEGEINSFRLHPLVREFSHNLVAENKRASFRNEAAHNLKIAYFNYKRLDEELQTRGVQQVIDDLQTAIDWWDKEDKKRRTAEVLHGTMLISSHVLLQDPSQLAAQLTGRLLDEKASDIRLLVAQVQKVKKGIWLKPLTTSLIPHGGPLIRTIIGHTASVNTVAITPDGKKIISGSDDGTIRIWETESGNELVRFVGHTDEVYALTVIDEGKSIISGSKDCTIKIWEIETGKEIRTLKGHTKQVNALAVTPDGKKIVSGSSDKTLKIWGIETGKEIRTLKGHTKQVNALAVTPDGKKIVSGSSDKTLKIWDIETGKEIRTFKHHTREVSTVVVIPNGKAVASGSLDCTVSVWDIETGVEVKRIETLKDAELNPLWTMFNTVHALSVTPNGTYIVLATNLSELENLTLYDIISGIRVSTFKGHSDSVNAVAVTSDSKKLVSASSDGTIKVWHLKIDRKMGVFKGHANRITSIVVTPDNKHLVSASFQDTLKVWELTTGCEIYTIKGFSNDDNAMAVTPNGKWIVYVSDNSTIKVGDIKTGRTTRKFSEQPPIYVSGLILTPDGKKVISTSHISAVLEIWDLKTGRVIRSLKYRADQNIRTYISTNDSKKIVAAYTDGLIKIWNINTGKEIISLEGHNEWINALAMSPNGKYVVIGSSNKNLKIWNTETGKINRILKGHREKINTFVVTPDGKKVVSGSYDRTIKIWDLETCKELRTLKGHNNYVKSIAIMPNCKHLISGSADNILRVWEIETGEMICSFHCDSAIEIVSVTHNGKIIVAGDRGGQVHFLRLEGGSD